MVSLDPGQAVSLLGGDGAGEANSWSHQLRGCEWLRGVGCRIGMAVAVG